MSPIPHQARGQGLGHNQNKPVDGGGNPGGRGKTVPPSPGRVVANGSTATSGRGAPGKAKFVLGPGVGETTSSAAGLNTTSATGSKNGSGGSGAGGSGVTTFYPEEMGWSNSNGHGGNYRKDSMGSSVNPKSPLMGKNSSHLSNQLNLEFPSTSAAALSDHGHRRHQSSSVPPSPVSPSNSSSYQDSHHETDSSTTNALAFNWRGMRHGFALTYADENYLDNMKAGWQLYWTDRRHNESGMGVGRPEGIVMPLEERMKEMGLERRKKRARKGKGKERASEDGSLTGSESGSETGSEADSDEVSFKAKSSRRASSPTAASRPASPTQSRFAGLAGLGGLAGWASRPVSRAPSRAPSPPHGHGYHPQPHSVSPQKGGGIGGKNFLKRSGSMKSYEIPSPTGGLGSALGPGAGAGGHGHGHAGGLGLVTSPLGGVQRRHGSAPPTATGMGGFPDGKTPGGFGSGFFGKGGVSDNGFNMGGSGVSESLDPSRPKKSDIPRWQSALDLALQQPSDMAPMSAYFDPSSPPLNRWKSVSRSRTLAGALNLCLRLGYDPPDVIKTQPCANMETWVDTTQEKGKDRLMAMIGDNLQRQYENLSVGTAGNNQNNQSGGASGNNPATGRQRWRIGLDPTTDQVRKTMMTLRKQAKAERVLFHYNGHGVPRPTPSGEVWFFNHDYTQYIPVNVGDLLTWGGSPMVFVWDCGNAGNAILKMEEWAEKKDREDSEGGAKEVGGEHVPGSTAASTAQKPEEAMKGSLTIQVPYAPNLLQLAACSPQDLLPMHPELPADVFTCCLTSPIEMALKFFWLRNPLHRYGLKLEDVTRVEGRLNDRRTPLGELNWIFNAVTDTIAWNSFPSETFQRLFRHDMMIASLYRGFLLAQRVMRSYDCAPMSTPRLPDTHEHPLWSSWDLHVDFCLSQIPKALERQDEIVRRQRILLEHQQRGADQTRLHQIEENLGPIPPMFEYRQSDFFVAELTAFEVWLKHAAVSKTFPPQLPLVLQVLLSQNHRVRALLLLCSFLDFGPRAVEVALGIGIFPYVLKLLQSPAPDLRAPMIFIWTRILAVYQDCRESLIGPGPPTPPSVGTAQGQNPQIPPTAPMPMLYFMQTFKNLPKDGGAIPAREAEHLPMCLFIIATIARSNLRGQLAAFHSGAVEACITLCKNQNADVRSKAALCLGSLWDGSSGGASEIKGKACGVFQAHQVLISMILKDTDPEVRAAAMFALGTLAGASAAKEPERRQGRSLTCSSSEITGMHAKDQERVMLGTTMGSLKLVNDGSPLVRKELVVMLSAVALEYRGHLAIAAYETFTAENNAPDSSHVRSSDDSGFAERTSNDGDRPSRAPQSGHLARLTALLESSSDLQQNTIMDSSFRSVVFGAIYETLLILAVDPLEDIAEKGSAVVDAIHDALLASELRPFMSNLPLPDVDVVPPPAPPTISTPSTPAPHDASLEPETSPHRRKQGLLATVKSFTSLATLGGPNDESTVSSSRPTTPKTNGAVLPTTSPKPNAVDKLSRPSLTRNNSTPAELLLHKTASKVPTKSNPPSRRPSDSRPTPPRLMPPLAGENSLLVESPIATTGGTIDSVIEDAKNKLIAKDQDQQKRKRHDITEAHDPVKDILPFKSEFFELNAEWYCDPILKQREANLPGSKMDVACAWMLKRNERIIEHTQRLKVHAATHLWDENVVTLHTPARPSELLFHQFEPHLIGIDEHGLTVHDWHANSLLNRIPNSTIANCKVTSIDLVNEDQFALLLTASADGSIRLFRNYANPAEIDLVTTFRGQQQIIPSSPMEAGIITDWHQVRGHLLVGGNTKTMRLWEPGRELWVQDIMTHSDSCVTSITSDQVSGEVVVAGFGDGSIRVYDKRASNRQGPSRLYQPRPGRQSWIRNIHMQRGGLRELVSGSLQGEVCLWDIRSDAPLRRLQAHQAGLTAVSVHEHAPVFATYSRFNVAKVWKMNGEEPLTKLRLSNSAHPYQSNIPLDGLAFHPHHMVLATSVGENQISVNKCLGTDAFLS